MILAAVVLLLCSLVFYVVGPARCGTDQTWTVRYGCYPGADAR